MSYKTDKTPILANYSELRTYTNFEGVVYVEEQGLFYPSTSGGDNGGTIIRSSYNITYSWYRIFDGITYRPEWWVIGDYSSEVSDNVVINNRDQLAAAMAEAGTGGKIMLNPAVTYLIDIHLPFKEGMSIEGGGVLKRANSISSALTADYNANDVTIEVTDGSLFRRDQLVWIADTSTTYGGFADSEDVLVSAGNMRITNISGNTLTVSFAPASTAVTAANGVLYTMTDIFEMSNVSGYWSVRNLTIDGNEANNPIRSWTKNSTMTESGNGDSYGTYDNVFFKDLPAENYIGPACKFYGCWFENLYGSCFHASNAAGVYRNPFIMSGCYVKGVNKSTDVVAGHSESPFTMSAFPYNLTITACHFEDGEETIFGGVGNDNINILISNCTFKNFQGFFGTRTSTSVGFTTKAEVYKIDDCVFDNCGDFIIINTATKTVADGSAMNGFSFTNNTVFNGRFVLKHATNAVVKDNQFIYEEGRGTFTGFSEDVYVDFPCYIGITGVDRLSFSDNRIEGPPTPNPFVEVGIYFPLEYDNNTTGRKRNTADGVVSSTYYPHGININNNFVFGFTKGISTRAGDIINVNHEAVAVGWKITNNVIITDRSGTSDNTVGLCGEAGMELTHNTIYMTDNTGATQTSVGIWVLGLDSGTSDAQKYVGCIATHNTVIGPCENPIYVGSTTGDGNRCVANCIVQYNRAYGSTGGTIVNGPPADSGSTQYQKSYIADNLNINSSILPEFTLPELPYIGGWQEDTNFY